MPSDGSTPRDAIGERGFRLTIGRLHVVGNAAGAVSSRCLRGPIRPVWSAPVVHAAPRTIQEIGVGRDQNVTKGQHRETRHVKSNPSFIEEAEEVLSRALGIPVYALGQVRPASRIVFTR